MYKVTFFFGLIRWSEELFSKIELRNWSPHDMLIASALRCYRLTQQLNKIKQKFLPLKPVCLRVHSNRVTMAPHFYMLKALWSFILQMKSKTLTQANYDLPNKQHNLRKDLHVHIERGCSRFTICKRENRISLKIIKFHTYAIPASTGCQISF